MTKFHQDILNEPAELLRSLDYTLRDGRPAFEEAVRILKQSRNIYIVGIGSSWNAGLAVLSFFNAAGRPVMLHDASELLHFGAIPKNSTIVFLSRSGKSTEIVQMLSKVASDTKIIAITNTPESPLALGSHVVLKMMAAFDHAVSVSMYSAMALIGALLACALEGNVDDALGAHLHGAISATPARLSSWREQIAASDWLDPQSPTYLLARGASLASCHEGQLLWEEAAKLPASAMPTGAFRHGPQEVVRKGLRIVLCIDRETLRTQDLALAKDLRKLGVKLLLIGQDLPPDACDLVLQIPAIKREWQFLLDIIPIQMTAEVLAEANHQDCDTFRLCQYIVEDEGGIIPAGADLEEVTRK